MIKLPQNHRVLRFRWIDLTAPAHPDVVHGWDIASQLTAVAPAEEKASR